VNDGPPPAAREHDLVRDVAGQMNPRLSALSAHVDRSRPASPPVPAGRGESGADAGREEGARELMLKQVAITPALRDAIEAVRQAAATYRPGRDSASVVELPLLALAEARLAALHTQTVARLPVRAVVARRRERRRRA
jgi:hypothetical protein